jgi:hypothetical protein
MDEKFWDWAEKIEQLLAQYTGPTADIVLTAVRVEAIQSLVYGTICAVVAVCCYFSNKRARKELEENRWSEWWEGIDIGSLIVGAIVVFCCILILCDVWVWVALVRPELYLAHKILGL